MKTNIMIPCEKITAFLHIPVLCQYAHITNPYFKEEEKNNDDASPEKILLPYHFWLEYKKFITTYAPHLYKFLVNEFDEEHDSEGIIYHLIIDKKTYKLFIEFMENFCKTCNVKLTFRGEEKNYTFEEMNKLINSY